MKKPIFGCSWKMYFKDNEAIQHALALKERINNEVDVELYVLPSFTTLREVQEILKDTPISVGAQNVCWAEKGAYTGEVSILSLQEIGIKYVEIGHSERKEYFGETDKMINKKIKTALEYGLTPVFCIGEGVKEKDDGLTEEILARQLQVGLEGICLEDARKIIFAYEPIWAIGKTDAALPGYVEFIHKYIRTLLKYNFLQGNNEKEFMVIYGGSVSSKNVAHLIKQPNIDGVFVGRASLNPDRYFELLDIVKNHWIEN